MIELVLHNPTARIGRLPNKEKALIFVDAQSGITVTTALDEESAQKIGEALAAADVEIAHKLPADPRIFPGEDGHS